MLRRSSTVRATNASFSSTDMVSHLSHRYDASRRRSSITSMMTPDLALALLINRTSAYYDAHPPGYMTYVERTHVRAQGIGRTQDIDRSVAVRVADNYAAMKDLPNGEQRVGQAFPIIPYFDPISAFSFSY